jgi:hypothetical protein
MPEIISVTSEQLQAQIRTLLPSQQGFGDDLSNLEETFFIYLRAGDSIKATADNSCHMSIAYRQVATVTGVLVNPLGFTSE